MKFVNNYRLIRFLKCPFCDFVNIHEDSVMHHIKYTDDPMHKVDLEKIDKSEFIIED
jgi:hypothetical protein